MKRFWTKVNKTETCWNWTAYCNVAGYGTFLYNGKARTAHRIAWLLATGKDPGNLLVLHKCDNRKCVNPEHLYIGTAADNVRDSINRRRIKVGEAHYAAKLSVASIEWAVKEYNSGRDQKSIAKELNVSPSALYNALKGKTWKHVGINSPITKEKGFLHRKRGADHYLAKLNDSMVLEAKHRRLNGETFSAIASDLGVDKTTLWGAVRGKTWKHVKLRLPLLK